MIYDEVQLIRDLKTICDAKGHNERYGFFTIKAFKVEDIPVYMFLGEFQICDSERCAPITNLKMDSPLAQAILRTVIKIEEGNSQ